MLHAHLDAMVTAPYLLQTAMDEPALHVRVTIALGSEGWKAVLPEFKALPVEERQSSAQAVSLCSPEYVLGTWVPLQTARATFDAALGGPDGFDDWVIRGMTVNPAEAYGTHNTVTKVSCACLLGYAPPLSLVKIWQKFSSTFIVVGGLIRYMPVFERCIKQFLLHSVEDGISYVEPRINFLFKCVFLHLAYDRR